MADHLSMAGMLPCSDVQELRVKVWVWREVGLRSAEHERAGEGEHPEVEQLGSVINNGLGSRCMALKEKLFLLCHILATYCQAASRN